MKIRSYHVLQRIAGIRLLQHIVFWLLSFLILLQLFAGSSEPERIDSIYTLLFVFTLIIPVYMNLFLVIPGFLSKGKYLYTLLLSVGLILIFSLFNLLFFSSLTDYLLKDYYFISYYGMGDILKYFTVFVLLTSLLKLFKAWFVVSEARQKLIEAERLKAENELLALKSQINPHFMFNSLNSIYSLVLKKSDSAPGALIKLSDILRYVIYEAREESLPLKKEIDMIKDYIDLQGMRYKDNRVVFHTQLRDDSVLITPLLFLPLIENGFKHGIEGNKEGKLKISLIQKEKELIFKTENRTGEVDIQEKQQLRGIGIENVKRRLELSYPGNYEFILGEEADTFSICLTLRLTESGNK